MPAEVDDVVALVQADHRKVESVFSALTAPTTPGLWSTFASFEKSLYVTRWPRNWPYTQPFVAMCPTGTRWRTPASLNRLKPRRHSPGSTNWRTSLVALRAGLLQLRRDVLEHAQHEEREVSPALESHTSAKDLRGLGERYAKALASAPTHPHPHAPDTPPGNRVLGPVAAVMDKIRDSMKKSA